MHFEKTQCSKFKRLWENYVRIKAIMLSSLCLDSCLQQFFAFIIYIFVFFSLIGRLSFILLVYLDYAPRHFLIRWITDQEKRMKDDLIDTIAGLRHNRCFLRFFVIPWTSYHIWKKIDVYKFLWHHVTTVWAGRIGLYVLCMFMLTSQYCVSLATFDNVMYGYFYFMDYMEKEFGY